MNSKIKEYYDGLNGFDYQYKKLEFKSFCDHMASYYFDSPFTDEFHEFNVIHAHATLLDKMTLEDLLFGDVIYFSHRCWGTGTDATLIFEYRKADEEFYIKIENQMKNN